LLLLLASLPVFVGGLIEDLTKQFSASDRLLASFAAAALGFLLMDGRVTDLALPGSGILEFSALSFLFTVFAVGGFAHALNIVDGFNGLSGTVALLMLIALGLVAVQVGDSYVAGAAMVIGAAVVAFLLWNFPKGLIFFGDSGAYLLGFLIAELAVLLTHRNSEISPWFPLSLLLYPVVETCFSIYRKKFLRGQSPGEPDGLHLHMLIYKRLVRKASQRGKQGWKANALTSPYLVLLSALSIVPSVLAWGNTLLLQTTVALFTGCYVWLYWRIVRFRTPGVLVLRNLNVSRGGQATARETHV
jgi:UDP-N-acetylmuramyl pentapeptide phosphotransferase/UDP-N-acetylglucosamine-1-phosphate transferase